MFRTLSLTLAISLTLTAIAEARDGGERTGPLVQGIWFPVSAAEAATVPVMPDAVSQGRNVARTIPAETQPVPTASGLHGRNERFADA